MRESKTSKIKPRYLAQSTWKMELPTAALGKTLGVDFCGEDGEF